MRSPAHTRAASQLCKDRQKHGSQNDLQNPVNGRWEVQLRGGGFLLHNLQTQCDTSRPFQTVLSMLQFYRAPSATSTFHWACASQSSSHAMYAARRWQLDDRRYLEEHLPLEEFLAGGFALGGAELCIDGSTERPFPGKICASWSRIHCFQCTPRGSCKTCFNSSTCCSSHTT